MEFRQGSRTPEVKVLSVNRVSPGRERAVRWARRLAVLAVLVAAGFAAAGPGWDAVEGWIDGDGDEPVTTVPVGDRTDGALGANPSTGADAH